MFSSCGTLWRSLLNLSSPLFSSLSLTAKAARNKKMMLVLMSEWGKLLATATSYERAHFFDNVEHEVGQSRECFKNMGQKITAVTSGEHKERIYLTIISLAITAVFVMALPAATEATGLQLASLTM